MHRLKMNTDKTDFIWLGSKHQLAKIQSQSIALDAVHAPVSSVVTCLGVQFDSHLTFTPHVQGLIVVSTIFGSYGTYEAVADN